MSKFLTFHHILHGCEEGNPEAWRIFLAEYTPVALQFLAVYSPWSPDVRLDGWRDVLRGLSANEGAALKGFSHQSEREFLVGLRGFLQEVIATTVEPSQDAVEPPAPTAAGLSALLDGLPLLHRELVFLTLAGYSQSTIERILRITPAVAREGLERLRINYARMLERTEDRCLWPSAWVNLCRAAQADAQKECTSLRQLIRILDGQATWYDKTPAEEHRMRCIHCLELWTALLEVVAWDRTRQPLAPDKVKSLIVDIPQKSRN